MRCGIEFEYMLLALERTGEERILDFSSLDFARLSGQLAHKPGRSDPRLATGDLGIKSGYWYLEGDERFHGDGRFRTMAVKGVEIRTPPAASVGHAIEHLCQIEQDLSAILARHGMSLAIIGFNPLRPAYHFDPPLNDWEQALRRTQRSYAGAHISTLSYGPDINLSLPQWTPEQSLDAARKLCSYAPFIVPFSFSSPFFADQLWHGLSKRTFERAPLRPAVKLFLAPEPLDRLSHISQLVHPARLPSEAGRIEFKAFDAQPSLDILSACCHLLEGICLAPDLPSRREHADLDLYRRAALFGFADTRICQVATEILSKAKTALWRSGNPAGADSLKVLEQLLRQRRTPAHDLLAAWQESGRMFKPGGHLRCAQRAVAEIA